MRAFKYILFSGLLLFQLVLASSAVATTPAECFSKKNDCEDYPDSSQDRATCLEQLDQCYANCPECNKAASSTASTTPTGPALDQRSVPADYGKNGIPAILPDCAFNAYGCTGKNADIGIFVTLGVNIAQVIFSVIGTIAFVMFIYGGFTMILSFGSAEKFKKGRDILVAAVVGMFIAFGAYLLIDFILDALQVGNDFRSVGSK